MDKLKRYPFVTWAAVLLTIVVFTELFGPENVWLIIAGWLAPPG